MLDTVVDENPDWITVELVDAQGNPWYAAKGAGLAMNNLDPYTVMQRLCCNAYLDVELTPRRHGYAAQ